MTWTDKEQLDWLQAKIPEYHVHQASKTVRKFWPVLYAAWFKEFPHTEDIDKLGPAQKGKSRRKARKAAREKGGPPDQRERLKQWFNNNGRATAKSGGGRKKLLKLIKKPTRKLADYQMYSQMFYDDKLREPIDTEWDKYLAGLPEGETAISKLVFINQQAKLMLKKEPAEVKAMVEKARAGTGDVSGDEDDKDDESSNEESEKEGDGDGEGDGDAPRRSKSRKARNATPRSGKARVAELEAYADAIECLPATASTLVDEILAQTGWVCTMIFGGPLPRDKGKIMSYAVHATHADSQTFAIWHPDFKEGVQAPAIRDAFCIAKAKEESRESSTLPPASGVPSSSKQQEVVESGVQDPKLPPATPPADGTELEANGPGDNATAEQETSPPAPEATADITADVSKNSKAKKGRLTEAEILREENIKRNRALLDELDLHHALHFPKTKTKPKPTRVRKRKADAELPEVTRKSARLRRNESDAMSESEKSEKGDGEEEDEDVDEESRAKDNDDSEKTRQPDEVVENGAKAAVGTSSSGPDVEKGTEARTGGPGVSSEPPPTSKSSSSSLPHPPPPSTASGSPEASVPPPTCSTAPLHTSGGTYIIMS
ncbi:hypothetical protein BV25DRAFT_1838668 [Artomyces pyxidatus]|uniref:Uncharacterized protein n=1 Tax=Artomyces pyxidatus TaxID=48021 RepID=A0ACB8SYV3_9AGAM|nr:hypothetical protein BV25DRAFT_1838668 [Artomyces pyxidatus]